ncbi:MAG: hypothetical protein NUW37_03165 [Planctomycetes bacterium]|nr:hypothetical protein [Planctomycetota bacterium]
MDHSSKVFIVHTDLVFSGRLSRALENRGFGASSACLVNDANITRATEADIIVLEGAISAVDFHTKYNRLLNRFDVPEVLVVGELGYHSPESLGIPHAKIVRTPRSPEDLVSTIDNMLCELQSTSARTLTRERRRDSRMHIRNGN